MFIHASFSAHTSCDSASYLLQFKSVDYGIYKWMESHKFDADQVRQTVDKCVTDKQSGCVGDDVLDQGVSFTAGPGKIN